MTLADLWKSFSENTLKARALDDHTMSLVQMVFYAGAAAAHAVNLNNARMVQGELDLYSLTRREQAQAQSSEEGAAEGSTTTTEGEAQ